MATQLSIYNEAARICGEGEIQSIDETGESVRQIRNAWSDAVAYCFEQSGWEMAEKRAQLARSAVVPAFGYDYYYETPADCVRVLLVSASGVEDDDSLSWKLEGGRIATSHTEVYIRYLSHDNATRPGRWTQTFADWVGAEIAKRVSPKLNPKAVELAMQLTKERRVEARNLDAIQQPAKRFKPSSWAMAPRGMRNPEQGR